MTMVATERENDTSKRRRPGGLCRRRGACAPLWVGTLIVAALGAGVFGRERIPVLHPLDAAGRVTYFVADGEPGSTFEPADRELAVWAIKQWERVLNGALRFQPSVENDAMVRVFWVPAGGGQYGEMRAFEAGKLHGAAVFIRPDTDALGPEIAEAARRDPLMRDTVVYLTCLHELGHALGLEHTDSYGDIMYFFGYGGDIPGFFARYRRQLRTRADIATTSGLSPSDIARVRALYR